MNGELNFHLLVGLSFSTPIRFNILALACIGLLRYHPAVRVASVALLATTRERSEKNRNKRAAADQIQTRSHKHDVGWLDQIIVKPLSEHGRAPPAGRDAAAHQPRPLASPERFRAATHLNFGRWMYTRPERCKYRGSWISLDKMTSFLSSSWSRWCVQRTFLWPAWQR